ncbi:hypothetical protein DV735_g3760, partial [Chaetothyriales sp. CBS 134920]
MNRSSSANEVEPAEEAQSEGIERDAQPARDASETEPTAAGHNATTMVDALSDLAEQAWKLDLDEEPEVKTIARNANLNSLQGPSIEGEKQQQNIKWLLFDCDNTIVLSETLAFMASFDLVNEVLAYKQVDHRYGRDELLVHFMGLSFSAMCRKMAKQFHFQWTAEDASLFEQREEDEVIKLFHKGLKAVPGILDVLARIVGEMRYNIAIVSSSSLSRINAALDATNLRMFFPDKYVFSAKSCLENRTCKPDPAIYLYALEELGVKAQDCVCIEDSRAGVMAATRAGIPCIGFLGSFTSHAMQEQLWTDFHKDGCAAIMWEWNQFFDILSTLERV